MDELEVLKLKYQHMEKRNKRLAIETWEDDMILRTIAMKVVKTENAKGGEFLIHLYNEKNPIFKALNVKLNPKWIEDIKKAKEKINNEKLKNTKSQKKF